MAEEVGDIVGTGLDFFNRPLFTVSGITLTVGVAVVVGILVYLAFFRK